MGTISGKLVICHFVTFKQLNTSFLIMGLVSLLGCDQPYALDNVRTLNKESLTTNDKVGEE